MVIVLTNAQKKKKFTARLMFKDRMQTLVEVWAQEDLVLCEKLGDSRCHALGVNYIFISLSVFTGENPKFF